MELFIRVQVKNEAVYVLLLITLEKTRIYPFSSQQWEK